MLLEFEGNLNAFENSPEYKYLTPIVSFVLFIFKVFLSDQRINLPVINLALIKPSKR
jgi:hypothetical protein